MVAKYKLSFKLSERSFNLINIIFKKVVKNILESSLKLLKVCAQMICKNLRLNQINQFNILITKFKLN
jgi:hypothetical protein